MEQGQDRLAILTLDPTQTQATQDETTGAMYFEGFAVTEQMTPDKLVFPLSGLQNLPDYQRNPIVLWQHDWHQPIGHAELVEARGDGLFVRDRLAPTELVQKTVWPLIQAGSIRGLSIGFRSHATEFDEETGVMTFASWSLHEHSLVSLPNNPGALGAAVQSMARGMGYASGPGLLDQGASKVNHPIHEDQGQAWDGAGAQRRLKAWAGGDDMNWSKYRSAFLWYDSSAPDKLASYKLPVCDVFEGSPEVVWRACAAAMGAMMGSRGGVDMPASDKAGVMRILRGLYAKFDKEPPKQSDLGEVEWQADEKTITEINLFGEKLSRLCGAAQGVHDIAQHWQGAKLDRAAWGLLGEAELERLQQAREYLEAVLRYGGVKETLPPDSDQLLNALLDANEELMLDKLLA